jgi:hypothetical protein
MMQEQQASKNQFFPAAPLSHDIESAWATQYCAITRNAKD